MKYGDDKQVNREKDEISDLVLTLLVRSRGVFYWPSVEGKQHGRSSTLIYTGPIQSDKTCAL